MDITYKYIYASKNIKFHFLQKNPELFFCSGFVSQQTITSTSLGEPSASIYVNPLSTAYASFGLFAPPRLVFLCWFLRVGNGNSSSEVCTLSATNRILP